MMKIIQTYVERGNTYSFVHSSVTFSKFQIYG